MRDFDSLINDLEYAALAPDGHSTEHIAELLSSASEVIQYLTEPPVEILVYDREELYENCLVQVLTNSVTGETSVGFWPGESKPDSTFL